nr:hypothetical protein Itr_chr15CG07040 [Ipomoea trifida]
MQKHGIERLEDMKRIGYEWEESKIEAIRRNAENFSKSVTIITTNRGSKVMKNRNGNGNSNGTHRFTGNSAAEQRRL